MIKGGHCCNSKAIGYVDLHLWSHVDILAATVIAQFSNSLIGLEIRFRPSITAKPSTTWLIVR